MTVENSRDSIIPHEDPAYIASRPDWVMGKIPSLSDYRKLSVESEREAFTLARLGQEIAASVIPNYNGEPLKLSFTQALIMGAALITRPQAEKYGMDFERFRSVLLMCPTRYGKGYAYSTPIMTPEGLRTHGELEVGDYVFHPSGKPIQVVGKSDPFKCVYRVTLKNGSTFETSAEHEWVVWDKTKTKQHQEDGKRVVDERGGYRTLETHELLERGLRHGEDHCKFYVDSPQPLQFEEKDQPLDPYFFGCWLGDGTSKEPALTLNGEKATKILPHIPYGVTTVYEQQGCKRYKFSRQGIVTYLHTLGVFGDKHIPDCYKYGSPAQQRALLAGLLDTDGYIDKSGRAIISSANERLAKDILELLTVMGLCPYETITPAATSSSGIVGRHDIHQIGFQPSYQLPTHRAKLTRIVPHRRIGIENVEPIENGEEGNCIQVDSPDGLYLVGEKLVPTHNSFINALVAIVKAAVEGLEVKIAGANKEKAGIIQEKIVTLLPHTIKPIQDGLIVTDSDGDVNKKVLRMTTQASKEALMFKNGGSIKAFSTSEAQKNSAVAAAGAIGVGGDFCVHDEIQLMSSSGFRTASRFMMEHPDTKRFCVGNPQINGHFRELYDDPSTFVVHINEITAIIEGRLTRESIKLTGIPSYSNEYRAFVSTEFPDSTSGNNFFPTIPSLVTACTRKSVNSYRFIGIDSAYKGADGLVVTLLTMHEDEDGNRYVIVDKQYDLKEKYPQWGDNTTLNIALDILKMWQEGDVVSGCIDIGLGIHIYEKLLQLAPDLELTPIAFQQKPTAWRVEADAPNATMAANVRAEMHLDLRDLCEQQLLYLSEQCYDSVVNQMREVSSVAESLAKIRIEAKKDIKRRLGRSPDSLDSLCLAVHAMVLSGLTNRVVDEYEDEAELVEVF